MTRNEQLTPIPDPQGRVVAESWIAPDDGCPSLHAASASEQNFFDRRGDTRWHLQAQEARIKLRLGFMPRRGVSFFACVAPCAHSNAGRTLREHAPFALMVFDQIAD